ncbi:hypothetical protein CRM22_005579 [Opisthorchis felineus]|uniref:Nuclear receptor domain-containing protein n=1 Tax=Opisthorchis felineus TaxID=147828 RepID=A0A4S2LQF4_OPIFE|nr:hypothetical protein CRM22_005579 [Opisthorchis felineus]
MDNRRRNKQCNVCGDAAMGFNFGAVTCESCKAFFRRTARKAQVANCVFNEKCTITVATRRFCSHCRLKKCFAAGMKSSLILDDKAKQERHEKIAKNRQARTDPLYPISKPGLDTKTAVSSNSGNLFLQDTNTGETATDSSTSAVETFERLLSPDAQEPNVLSSNISYTNDQWRTFLEIPTEADASHVSDMNDRLYCRNSQSSASSSFTSGDYFQEQASTAATNTTAPGVVHTAPTPVLSCFSDNRHLNEDMARLLSHYQWTAINDLRHAYETNFVQDDSCSNLKRPDLTLSSLINTSRFLVRRLINFAKTLADFSQLKQDSQISLLKGVVLSTLFLLSARHYDVEKDVWLTPKGEVPTQILKVATGMDKFYEEHTKYCRNFNALVAQDPNLVSLMQALCLFTPDRPSLDARQTVANVHDRYYLLLKHYLEAKVGFAGGRAMLASVLANLNQLEALTINYGHMLMQLDPTKVDPLLMEIFNLTPLSSKIVRLE